MKNSQYQKHLEQTYGLCDSCNRHVKKVLHEKKRMVLGSKFLEFIIKRAEIFKTPHLQFAKNQQRQRMKRLFTKLLITLTIINMLVGIKQISKLDKEIITSYLPEPIGSWLFVLLSHTLTIFKIITSLVEPITSISVVQKISLFFKTLAFMTMYSVGLKTQQVSDIDTSKILLLGLPFLATFLSLVCVILDSFRINRRIFILMVWSCSAAGLLEKLALSQEVQMVVLSWFTTIALITHSEATLNKPSTLNGNITNSSFHRIYSEDYMSECDNDTMETVNMLNDKLDSTMGDSSSVRSFPTESFHRSPRMLSDLHLNYNDDRSSFRSSAFQPAMTNRSAFTSNMELNRNYRPGSAFDMNKSFAGALESLNVTNDKFSHPAPQSPFSYSSNVVYGNHGSLLTPSRFSTSHLPSSATSNASWLSGGYFNGQPRKVTSPKSDKVLDFLNKIQPPENTTLSRGSSQSSGFESQFSKETSFCREQETEKEQAMSYNPRNRWERQNPMAGSLLNLSALGVSRESLMNKPASEVNGRIYRPLSAMDMTRVPNAQNNPFNLNQINEEIPAAWDTLSFRSGNNMF
ncbi:TMEM201.2 family protein [Megaselia abdita]